MLFLLVIFIPYGPESAKSREEFRIKDPVNYYHFHVTLFILAVSAIGMLKGNNMAKWLFVAWLAYRVYCNIGTPVQLSLVVVITAVVCFYLFRPQATAFFKPKAATLPPST